VEYPFKGICLSEIGYHDFCGGGKEKSRKEKTKAVTEIEIEIALQALASN